MSASAPLQPKPHSQGPLHSRPPPPTRPAPRPPLLQMKAQEVLSTPPGKTAPSERRITVSDAPGVQQVARRVFVGTANKPSEEAQAEARTKQMKEFKEALTDQFQGKGYSKEQVQSAIDALFEEVHIVFLKRADPMQSDRSKKTSEWEEKTIADLLQEPGNESLRLALVKLRDDYQVPTTTSPQSQSLRKSETNARCNKDLQIFVLQNMQRNPKTVLYKKGGGARQHVMKGTGALSEHVGSDKLCTLDRIAKRNEGLPSEADKGSYRKGIEGKNTNLGAVVHHDATGKPERVLCTRSGKSDTRERLQELAATSCLEALECSTGHGFTEANGKLEFQLVVTSFLDQSSVKALPEMLKGLFSHSENEQASFQAILKAQSEWPENGVEITVLHKGEPKKVILKKPIIRNQLLSSTVRGTGFSSFRLFRMGQKRADDTNLAANHELLKTYLKAHPKDLDKIEAGLKVIFPNATDNQGNIDFSKISPQELEKHRKTIEVYQFRVMQLLNKRAQDKDICAKALFVTMFRQYPTLVWPPMPPSLKNEIHAADLLIYQNIALRELNLTGAMQCKSGTDRTGLGVALAVAQDQFRQKHEIDFDPEHYRDVIPGSTEHTELVEFKEMFRVALKELAVSMTVETKGYFGIKWGGGVPFIGGVGNPVANKYLFIEGDKPKADVEGLTYDDIRRGGLKHYKGAIVDRKGLFGKSQQSTNKELKELQKRLDPEALQKAREAATTSLERMGISHIAPIFNDKLQLQVPISELKLADKHIEALKVKIEDLGDSRNTADHLQLYALERIVLHYEAGKKAEGGQNIVLDLVTPPHQTIKSERLKGG